MKEQRITIEIGEDGLLSADAEGFSGDLCLQDLEKILDGLGAEQAVVRKGGGGGKRAAAMVTMGKKT
jgi:hypothetical protein